MQQSGTLFLDRAAVLQGCRNLPANAFSLAFGRQSGRQLKKSLGKRWEVIVGIPASLRRRKSDTELQCQVYDLLFAQIGGATGLLDARFDGSLADGLQIRQDIAPFELVIENRATAPQPTKSPIRVGRVLQ